MQAIIDNLPLIIAATVELVTTLIDAVIDNLPLVIQMVLDLVIAIATAIVNNLPLIAQSAVELVMKLITTIISKLPEIVAMAGQIVTSIITGIGQLASQVYAAGAGIVQGIIAGIKAGWQALLNSFKALIAGLPDWVKKLLGVASPSKIFAAIFKQVPLGMLEGFEKTFPKLENSVMKALGSLVGDVNLGKVSGSVGIGASLQPAYASASTGGDTYNFYGVKDDESMIDKMKTLNMQYKW